MNTKEKRILYDLKAYKELKKKQQQFRVKELKRVIDNTACISKGSFSKQLFGAAVNDAEIVVRQFLLRSIVENKINRVLINALGQQKDIVYPLPGTWINALRKDGIGIKTFRSHFAFAIFILTRFLYGVFSVFRQVGKAIAATFGKQGKKTGRYVFFDSLTKANLPSNEKNERNYDIISWYCQWEGKMHGLDSIVQTSGKESVINGVPIISTPSFIQPLRGAGKISKLVGWAIMAVLICIADLFRGRWWHALILSEAVNAAQIRIQEKEELAAEYLFHNSLWIYRPLWTYDAEKAGSQISFYFYSTNVEPLKHGPEYADPHVGWRTATWPRYLVWDQYQADFVRQSVERRATISVVGPIWFNSGNIDLPSLPGKSVAVFDVQPMREGFYYTMGIDFDYYTPTNANSFLEDIYTGLHEHKATLVFKRKRNIGKRVHYLYRNLITKLEKNADFISIDTETAAQNVIEKCVAVISTPFTSTALIGKQMGKPSVYYDPHGELEKTDKAAHGIDIVNGPDELKEWLNKILIEDLVSRTNSK
jgi:polysaccharide biosynthesis PFTS motif protein